MTKFVYLIESECGRVKIGNSLNPKGRLVAFSITSPRPLRLVATWPGDHTAERELHDRFIAHRTHNEWFRQEGALASFVEKMRGTGVEAIPDWGAVSWPNYIRMSRASKIEKLRIYRSSASAKPFIAKPQEAA
jgi:hypothetical protein